MSCKAKMKRSGALPVVMGGLMGVMMLWMLHGALTSDSQMGAWAVALFVAAHVAVVGGVGLISLFAARMSPRARALLGRVHRPNLRHVAVMGGAAVAMMAVVHVIIHGGVS